MSSSFHNQKVEVGGLYANDIVKSPVLSVDKINVNSSIVTQGSSDTGTAGSTISDTVTLQSHVGSGIIVTQDATAMGDVNDTFNATHSAVSTNSIILTNILGYSGTGNPHLRLSDVTKGSFNIIISNSSIEFPLDSSLTIGYTIL
jgi:hypothetical protein